MESSVIRKIDRVGVPDRVVRRVCVVSVMLVVSLGSAVKAEGTDADRQALIKQICSWKDYRERPTSGLWLWSFQTTMNGAKAPAGWGQEPLSDTVSVPMPPNAVVTRSDGVLELGFTVGESRATALFSLIDIPRAARVTADGGLIMTHALSNDLSRALRGIKYLEPWNLKEEYVGISDRDLFRIDGRPGCGGAGNGLGFWQRRSAFRVSMFGHRFQYLALLMVVNSGGKRQLLTGAIYGETTAFVTHMYDLWHALHGVKITDGLKPGLVTSADTVKLISSRSYSPFGSNGYPQPAPAPLLQFAGIEAPTPPFKRPKPLS